MQVLDSTLLTWRSPLSPGIWAHRSARDVGNHFFRGGECHLDPAYRLLAKRVGEVKLFLWSTIAFAMRRGRVVSPAA